MFETLFRSRPVEWFDKSLRDHAFAFAIVDHPLPELAIRWIRQQEPDKIAAGYFPQTSCERGKQVGQIQVGDKCLLYIEKQAQALKRTSESFL